MKLLVLTEIFPPQNGGSGRWFWETYRRLPRPMVHIVAGQHQDEKAFDATHDVSISRIPLRFRPWTIMSWRGFQNYALTSWRLFRIMSRQRIEMIHCGRCLPEGLLALAMRRLRGTPYACYVHGEELGTAQICREWKFLTKLALNNAEFILVNSRNSQRLLKEQWGIPDTRLRLFYPGVDTTRFTPANRDERCRQRLGWNDRPVVLTVARLQRRKGHDIMILAMADIRKVFPNVLYVIAGNGEERTTLQSLARQHGVAGNVQFMGEVDERTLVECYQQCDLFALPNRQIAEDFEGFGMVLLEAQACGKPVLAGASGGTSETMNSPHTGRTVPCERPEALAAAVIDLLSDSDRLAQMGKAARAWAVERFDWSVVGRQAEMMFRRAAPNGCPSSQPAYA